MSLKKKWMSNFVALGIGTACSKAAVFLLMPIYTASLTPADFGAVDILVSTAVLLLPLCSLYAPETVFRFIAGNESEGAVLSVGRWLLWRGGAVLCLLFPFLVCVPIIRPYWGHLLCYVTAAIWHSYYAHVLRARGQYGFFAVQQIFCTLLTIALAFLFLTVLRAGVRGYLAAVYFADGATSVILRCYLHPECEKKPDAALRRSMLGYGIPLIPTAALWWVVSALDRYVLLWQHGADEVGIYAAAYKLPIVMTLASSIVLEVWQYASLRVQESEQCKTFDRAYAMLLPGLVGLALVVILSCRPLMGLLLAGNYMQAVLYVPFITVALLFSALSSFLGSVYSLRLRSRATLSTAALGAAVHVIGCLALIPKFAAVGAVLATAFSYFVVYLRRMADCRRMMPFSQRLWKLLLAIGGLLLTSIFVVQGRMAAAFFCAPLALAPFWRELVLAFRTARAAFAKISCFLTKRAKRS
jgi:O-antigen/teichoic acid export membrane protein